MSADKLQAILSRKVQTYTFNITFCWNHFMDCSFVTLCLIPTLLCLFLLCEILNPVTNITNASLYKQQKLNKIKLFILLVLLCLPKQYRLYGDIPAVLVKEDLRCPYVHFLGTNGHLCRTRDVS
jgi:hypothetical protein